VSLSLLAAVSIGCDGRPARVPVAQIDFDQAAQKAVESYDNNADGAIDPDETESIPALRAAFASVDVNRDGAVTLEEIETYLRDLQKKRVAMVRWTLRLQLDGKPLKGATVKFEPAGFLVPGVLPADGVTDERGIVTLSVPEPHRPAPNTRVVHCGLYNVHVSKVESGRELLPEGYPTGAILGVEVRPEGQTNLGLADIRLSSKG
jgi:hypothetical protein